MAEVKRRLATVRLLTLVGAGGCGKTRLAIQVGADMVQQYSDGVWLAELAALSDPALVPQTVASALGVGEEPDRPPTRTLIDTLRPRQALLLLDNCEHLLAACARLAESLLLACPQLRILATSREGLGVTEEQTYRVPSLSLPDLDPMPRPERLYEFEAPRLFADRAGASQSGFAVTTANARSVVRICRRLDGIPLAIELAAARVGSMTVEEIDEGLDSRLRLLTGGRRPGGRPLGSPGPGLSPALPRQQTLRALVDWSYDLLSEPERLLFSRLSVFTGGWTVEAAEAVTAG
jgi:predicted ATPase